MAQLLADKLGGDFDVVLVHKIGAPDNPEFAIGSVSEFGNIFLNESAKLYRYAMDQIDEIAQNELKRLKKRRQQYSPIRPAVSPKDRIVIIVDDGIATGATMLAAIRAIRGQKPSKIVVASPVATPHVMDQLRSEADDVVVLDTPEDFFAISQFYEEFEQVTDDEVMDILTRAAARASSKSSGKKTA